MLQEVRARAEVEEHHAAVDVGGHDACALVGRVGERGIAMKMPDLYLDNIQKMRAIIAKKRVCCSCALFFRQNGMNQPVQRQPFSTVPVEK